MNWLRGKLPNPAISTSAEDVHLLEEIFCLRECETIADIRRIVVAALLSATVYKESDAEVISFLQEYCTVAPIERVQTFLRYPETKYIAARVAGDPETIYLAFRGSKVATDWITNLNAIPRNFATDSGTNIRGHSGFLRKAEALRIPRFVLEARRIVLCGHSAGGAVALLCMLLWHYEEDNNLLMREKEMEVITFGAPAVLSQPLTSMPCRIRHVVMAGDAVPSITFLPSHILKDIFPKNSTLASTVHLSQYVPVGEYAVVGERGVLEWYDGPAFAEFARKSTFPSSLPQHRMSCYLEAVVEKWRQFLTRSQPAHRPARGIHPQLSVLIPFPKAEKVTATIETTMNGRRGLKIEVSVIGIHLHTCFQVLLKRSAAPSMSCSKFRVDPSGTLLRAVFELSANDEATVDSTALCTLYCNGIVLSQPVKLSSAVILLVGASGAGKTALLSAMLGKTSTLSVSHLLPSRDPIVEVFVGALNVRDTPGMLHYHEEEVAALIRAIQSASVIIFVHNCATRLFQSPGEEHPFFRGFLDSVHCRDKPIFYVLSNPGALSSTVFSQVSEEFKRIMRVPPGRFFVVNSCRPVKGVRQLIHGVGDVLSPDLRRNWFDSLKPEIMLLLQDGTVMAILQRNLRRMGQLFVAYIVMKYVPLPSPVWSLIRVIYNPYEPVRALLSRL